MRDVAARLDSLTGLRFVAALLVFGSHLSGRLAPDHHALIAPFVDQGRAGVSFFFVLSGLVLTWSESAGGGAERFHRRRFARIYPAYLVTWVVGCLFTVLQAPQGAGLEKSVVGGLLLQSWIPSAAWYFWGNGVSWSLSCELVFYALFPLMIGPITRLGRAARYGLVGAMLIVIVALAVCGQLTFTGHGYGILPDTVGVWSVDYLPLSRLPEFVIGIVIALELIDGRSLDIGWYPAVGLAVTAYLVAGIWPSLFSSVAVVVVPFSVLLFAGASRDISGRRTIVAARPMIWLGEISFCFYLVHQMVIRAWSSVEARLPAHPPDAVTIVVTLAVSVGAAAALHYLVERPFFRLLGGRRTPLEPGHREPSAVAARGE